jgi:phosphopantothenoylcysteine decarboxylase/phosphopantothenate--cysteine ligase
MLEPVEIVEKAATIFASGLLAGLRVVVTAGPTHEAIDPVRYIANGSSGKMGYALADAAREAGANVLLISGPVSLPVPRHVDCEAVVSAQEMHEAVMRNIADCDIFLAVAAVADYRCQTVSSSKLHKENDVMTLTLQRNPDVVADVVKLEKKPFVVGFAAETENVLEQARAKRQRKKMDMIIANQVGHGRGIGSDDNEVTVISARSETPILAMPKSQLARKLINMISDEYKGRI